MGHCRNFVARVPLSIDVGEMPEGRLPEPIEVAAYFVVAEGLTNAAKHACASSASVRVLADGGLLRVEVGDDGVGGASENGGSGLRGLADRVEALDGCLTVSSPRGSPHRSAREPQHVPGAVVASRLRFGRGR